MFLYVVSETFAEIFSLLKTCSGLLSNTAEAQTLSLKRKNKTYTCSGKPGTNKYLYYVIMLGCVHLRPNLN